MGCKVRRSRFRLLVLMVMLGLNIALVAIAWQAISARHAGTGSSVSADPAATGGSATTALSAYALAAPVAAEWASDALLLRARGDWPEGSFSPQLATWVFVFYAPVRGETIQVDVHSREVQLVDASPTTAQLAPQPVSEWQIDSDAIVESFLATAGGHLFLDERANVSMVLSLSLDGTATWTATLVDWDTGDLLRRNFDASNGYLTAGL